MFLNSNFETLNISTIEALMHGLPVVASKCGSPQNYLNVQNSVQVNTKDTKDLVRGIKEMLLKYNHFKREMIHTSQNQASLSSTNFIVLVNFI